jgi:hypothetical protein
VVGVFTAPLILPAVGFITAPPIYFQHRLSQKRKKRLKKRSAK